MKKLLCIVLTLFCLNHSYRIHAQAIQPQANTAAELQFQLEKLAVTGRVLYLAAHPDDENTRLISYLTKQRKYEVAYLSLTRGDGGQNLIGIEQGVELGLIRTQELLAARRVDGARQYFTRAYDFGYSKSPEETFGYWNKDSILSDVVWVIRKFRPDVIVCRFPTTGEGGHGHHTASAILAREAFDAAADPNRFPEQLQYYGVWKTERLFWNTFNFGNTNTTAPDQLKLDVGVYDALLGKSYGELAAESRSQHRSQGFGSPRARGVVNEFFKLMAGSTAQKDLMEGVKTGFDKWSGNKASANELTQVIKQYAALQQAFQWQKPEKNIPHLLRFREALLKLNATVQPGVQQEITEKIKATEELIRSCLGWYAELTQKERFLSPGQSFRAKLQMHNRSELKLDVEVGNIRLQGWTGSLDSSLQLSAPADPLSSQPYWLTQSVSNEVFPVPTPEWRGLAENPPLLQVPVRISIEGTSFETWLPLLQKEVDPSYGELYQPVALIPELAILPETDLLMGATGQIQLLKVRIKAYGTPGEVSMKVQAPQGWVVVNVPKMLLFDKVGQEQIITLQVMRKEGAEKGELQLQLSNGSRNWNHGVKEISYPHIPTQTYFPKASVKLIPLDIAGANGRIGYIPGAGDKIPASLRAIGYEVVELTDQDLLNGDLSQFKAIITGVRAYNTNERLQVHHPRLMEYVKAGGRLLVQYNTNNRIGPLQANIGPYPFTISRNRVTDENARMNAVDTSIAFLRQPNLVRSADYEGWVQERGIYYVTERDANYKSLYTMADPGEQATDGALIYTQYGKGVFIYTGLAFFRQLPAGVPGAYRLFVNLIEADPK